MRAHLRQLDPEACLRDLFRVLRDRLRDRYVELPSRPARYRPRG